MDNSINGIKDEVKTAELPPIKTILSSETHRKADVSSIQQLLDFHGHTDAKSLAYFTISHCARRTLPYGMWTCFDGRQVLFNREYQIILEKKDDQRGYCDHDEWIDHILIETMQYFYNDVTSPIRYLTKHLGRETLNVKEANDCKKALLICMQYLKDFTPEEGNSVSERYSVAGL